MPCKVFFLLGHGSARNSLGKRHVQRLRPIKIEARFNFLPIIMARANSKRVRLNRSATPFWEGEYGADVSMIIPSSAANFLSFSFTKFLSIIETHIFRDFSKLTFNLRHTFLDAIESL